MLLLTSSVYAQTAQEQGEAIAREADRRDSGYGDVSADLEMVLTNKQGQSAQRQMHISSMETAGDGDKSITLFDSPPDVKGTAMLTFSHKREDDDQWLYLPALKRVKRIASGNRSGSFMGSEFAYEDMGSQEVEKFTYHYLRDEACGELQCFVIERYPVERSSGYKRQVVWVDKEHYRIQKTEFYDRKDVLLKTLNVSGYQLYLDHYWRAREMRMVNHQTGKSTTLTWRDYRFRTGLKDQDFNKARLGTLR